MAQARGICPVCGEERVVRGGRMREHNDPRTRRADPLGIRISDVCRGTYSAPSQLTKTAEEATAEAEKKQKKQINKKSAPFKDLPEDVKEALSRAVMTFDEPGVCPDGRRRFLKQHGFPLPPKKVQILLQVDAEFDDNDLNQYGEVKLNVASDLAKKFEEAIKESGTAPNVTKVGHGYR